MGVHGPRHRGTSQAVIAELFRSLIARALDAIESDLTESNPSAARSLLEGKAETLTLLRLGLQASIGLSFRTTNCMESLNALAEQNAAGSTTGRTPTTGSGGWLWHCSKWSPS